VKLLCCASQDLERMSGRGGTEAQAQSKMMRMTLQLIRDIGEGAQLPREAVVHACVLLLR
jgi:hypothetical protein